VKEAEVIARIAGLIRDNPSITVREIANALGYSEEKSVYYWLEKARFRGIREFKRAVLTGRFLPERVYGAAARGHGHVREPATYLLYPARRLPFVAQFGPQGRPVFAQEDEISPRFERLSDRAFAYALEDSCYAPLFAEGDLLVVDPEREAADGDLVILYLDAGLVALRRYYTRGTRPLLLHPVTGEDLPDEDRGAGPPVCGVVLQVIRKL